LFALDLLRPATDNLCIVQLNINLTLHLAWEENRVFERKTAMVDFPVVYLDIPPRVMLGIRP